MVLKQCPHLYLRAEEAEGISDERVLPLLIRQPLIKDVHGTTDRL